MKQLFSIALLLSCLCASAQPPGVDDSIMSIKRKWGRTTDAYNNPSPALPKSEYAAAAKEIEKIASLFKQAYPTPTGSEAAWYGSMENGPLFKGAPRPYSFRSLYKYYYYNKAYQKIVVTAETGTWGYVYVNHPSWFFDETKMTIPVNGTRQRVFIFPNEAGQWKGLTVYQGMHNDNALMTPITKEGKVFWKPVSQLQYLQEMRRRTEQLRDEQLAKPLAEQQKQMIRDFCAKELKVFDDYIQNNDEATLSQQAVVSNWQIFRGKFPTTKEKYAYRLVYIDESYFDRSLPSHLPQLMVLYWSWNKNAPGLFYKKQIEENFPVEQLKAMLPK